jgi:hypothetical protein
VTIVDPLLVFNGVDGSTGRYLTRPRQASELARLIRGEPPAEPGLGELKMRREAGRTTYGAAHGVCPEDLAQAGWALVTAQGAGAGALDALEPLRSLREAQAGRLYREFTAGDGLRRGESKPEFLERHGVGPGIAVPARVPYYLLLVGDPSELPYRFQYQLGVQYAVGRVCFDALEDYRVYAQSVVAAEATQRADAPATAALFGPRNEDDAATALSADQLVAPMAGELNARDVRAVIGAEATKARLLELVFGDGAPELLFTASHGVGFPAGNPRQRDGQGALVCQDWLGPQAWEQPIGSEHYLAGTDVDRQGAVGPSIVFSFACYGAGTPLQDDFPHLVGADDEPIAETPFVARLPQRLLAHRPGGALAFVGHVERAWGSSFMWGSAGAQRQTFTSSLQALLDGWRVGHAMEYLGSRYAELGSDLSATLEEIANWDKRVEDARLVDMWTANNDARSYVVVGDPAVRLDRDPRR